MNVDRITISLDAELARTLREVAERDGLSISRWVAEAIEDRVRNHLLGVALDAWEAEDGPFTEEELARAAASMGIPCPPASESAA